MEVNNDKLDHVLGDCTMLARCLAVCVLLGITTFVTNVNADPATQSVRTETFSFPLEKGQYFFIGKNDGKAGKSQWEIGTAPQFYAHTSPKSVSDKWFVKLSIHEVKTDDGQTTFSFEANLQKVLPDGTLLTRYGEKWEEKVATKDTETVALEKSDPLKDKEIAGFQMYEIPFVKVGGEKHFLVLGVGDHTDDFQKSIAIEKTAVFFKWDTPTLTSE